MKVILPVLDNSEQKYNLAKGIINAAFLCVYDCENKTYEWLVTEELTNKPGNLSLALKRKSISTVICNQMPIIALGLFIESGLKVFHAHGDNLIENIKLFENKQLQPFTAVSALAIQACSSGACGSCKSSCN